MKRNFIAGLKVQPQVPLPGKQTIFLYFKGTISGIVKGKADVLIPGWPECAMQVN